MTTPAAQLTRAYADLWGAAAFDPLARSAAAMHDELVALVDPRPGERLLDVACGTGPVALRAATLGANATGVDLAPSMVAEARAAAERAAVAATFVVADAERLPYGDGSFDVVVSAQGVMFALDHRRAAAELARVCAPGGRMGLSVLARSPVNDDFFALWQAVLPPRGARVGDPLRWGDEPYARELLGDAFALRFVERDAPLVAESGAELWRLHSTHCGPLKRLADGLPAEARTRLRSSFVAYYERYRCGPVVRVPRPYMLVEGRRYG